jgi:phosphohistidine swiveling domain-containing protein
VPTKLAEDKNLHFRSMFKVAKLSALYPGIENGEPFTKIMPSLGLYADKHFLYYGHKGVATAYYEQADIDAAGEFTFKHFSDPREFETYASGAKTAVADITRFLRELASLDINALPRKDIFDLVITNCQLEANIWAFYNSTQPQHLAVFERRLKQAIMHTLNDEAEITDAFAALTAYPDLSLLEQEELDWLEFLMALKVELKQAPLSGDLPPKLESMLQRHFDKYKTLQLGDGNWVPDINHFRNQLATDIALSENEITQRINELGSKSKTVTDNHARLISALHLTDQETYFAKVLSITGHLRLTMRSEGFIPLAYGEGKPILDELAKQFGTTGQVFRCLTYNELRGLQGGTYHLDLNLVKKRIGVPYLLVVENGSYTTLFGDEAKSTFRKLVQESAAGPSDAIKGNPAMSGLVTGIALVYHWGDEVPEDVKRGSILVTGQTRPQLLPLIRRCAGIVTDEGGLMSHAAIVARELKLPCLVGVSNATNIIRTGDRIELDADSGVIRILELTHRNNTAAKSDSHRAHPQTSLKPFLHSIPKIEHLLVTFDDITGDQRPLVGGKGNSLAAMHDAKLPVPPGFVITTEAYRKLHGYALPEIIINEFTAAFDVLGVQRVAVRSSAVAEDAAGSSWAGQFETVLNVTRSELAKAIQTCWDSASGEIVASYARDNHVSEEDLALGVVVQAMIDSEIAGVAFTKNPVTGNHDEIMIEACFGLGELLVQGLVTPDNFILQRQPLKPKSSTHYEQSTYLVCRNGQTVEAAVADPDAAKLNAQQVVTLAKLALKVEDFFGVPQDIEWALKDGKFFLVQSRPITT